MRPAILLCLLLALAATPLPAAAEVRPMCATSAHVGWQPDASIRKIDAAVVTVPGCDAGEPVTLQVITRTGDVPDVPLVAAAREGRATFDVWSLSVGLDHIVGARVTLLGEEVRVLSGQLNRSDLGETAGPAPDGSPLPASGAWVLTMLVLAASLIAAGTLVLRQRMG